jgi:uroporphyrinogen-III synthase
LDEVVTLLTAEPLAGRRVAFQHYGERNRRAVAALGAQGAVVIDVPVYRYQRLVDDSRVVALVDAVCAGRIDAVTFTSAPSIRNLLVAAAEHGREVDLIAALNDGGATVACVGPICAEAARVVGIERPVAPGRGRLGLLVRTLTEALHGRRRVLRCGPTDVVVQGRAVEVDGVKVDLPPRERAVLGVLLEKPGAVVSKPTILRSLGSDPGSVHALEATVARMRQHLGPAGASVRAVRGRGYYLDLEEPASGADALRRFQLSPLAGIGEV